MNIILAMKKITWLFVLLVSGTVNANPMFAPDTRNSVGIYVAQSTGHGDLAHLVVPSEWDVGPMTMVGVQYSQPVTFFRLPSRINLNLVQNFSYKSASGASFAAVGVSIDVALWSWCGWYAGLGVGPYMRDSGDRWVESRLVFGERAFVGKNITNTINAEIFTQHFSNGDFTDVNHGFNFVGLALNVSF